jgi:cell division protease FtsH
MVMTEDEKKLTAYHEAGHALCMLYAEAHEPLHKVTIIPRGRALGVTYQRPDSDRYNYPEAYLRARIVGMLGGRAAEEVVYGTKTTGAENDIEQATSLARRMVTRWGMSDRIGMVQLAPRDNPYLSGPEGYGQYGGGTKPFSEQTAQIIDAEVRRILEDSHEEAKRLLAEHRQALDALVEALLERETLDEQEILTVTGLPAAPAIDGGRLGTTPESARTEPVPSAATPTAATPSEAAQSGARVG